MAREVSTVDTPYAPSRIPLRRPRRSLAAGSRRPRAPASQLGRSIDALLELRHRRAPCALTIALDRPGSPSLVPARTNRSRLLEHAGRVAGALGILGFVASCLGVASGQLELETYLALISSSLAAYGGALWFVRCSQR